MGQARRWAGVALSGLVAASLCLGASGLALAASAGAGTEALDWNVGGSLEAGGIWSGGERRSSKFNEYRDMDNGFVGDLSLRGEKKDAPYFFDIRAKNPARDDQLYEGGFGRYGLFNLDLGWDRTPHVLSNSGVTIFQQNGSDFTLPSTLRNTITTTPPGYLNNTPANCTGITSWTCPNPVGSNTPIARGNAQFNFIRDTTSGLGRPVDLSFNTDVGVIDLKITPTDELRFDFGYSNLRREGYRPLGVVIGSPGGSPVELAIPIENMTQEIKFGAEYAREAFAFQFGYTGSIFKNDYQSYSWDNPLSTVTQSGITGVRTAASARGEVSAPPDNQAHTMSFTGTAALPMRSRINGTFAYSILRQDETFLSNIPVTGPGVTPSNTDTQGRNSPDAQANLVLGNIVLTSRPINNVTATARYRYFEYQNDTPQHTFNTYPEGLGTAAVQSTKQERYTKQNGGLDLGWRPIRMLALKTGYEYEHWNRGDFDDKSFSNTEHIAKAAIDVTPVDWFLGRLTYRYGDRYLSNYGTDTTVPASVPGFYKFNYADRRSNRADLLMQFGPWETVTPSLNFAYAKDDYHNSLYGLRRADNYSAGASLGWAPLSGVQVSVDYTYERYDYTLANQSGGTAVNDWESKAKDDFHTFGLNAVVDVVPKKFDVTFGYAVTLGYTTVKAGNTGAGFVPPAITATTTSTPEAFNWDRIENILQTIRIMGRYRLTEKLQVRGGIAYERYTERDFARDPMQPFMGDYERVTPTSTFPVSAGIQSTYLGVTQPNYESYTLGLLVRYDF